MLLNMNESMTGTLSFPYYIKYENHLFPSKKVISVYPIINLYNHVLLQYNAEALFNYTVKEKYNQIERLYMHFIFFLLFISNYYFCSNFNPLIILDFVT